MRSTGCSRRSPAATSTRARRQAASVCSAAMTPLGSTPTTSSRRSNCIATSKARSGPRRSSSSLARPAGLPRRRPGRAVSLRLARFVPGGVLAGPGDTGDEGGLDAGRLRVTGRWRGSRPAIPRDVLHAARHLAAGLDLGSIVAGLSEGIEAAEAKPASDAGSSAISTAPTGRSRGSNSSKRWAACGGRDAPTGSSGWVPNSTELGIDLASFAPAFRAAQRFGFRRTCHAGEAVGVGPDNIRIALDDLGAERIDHGVAIVEDQALPRRGDPDPADGLPGQQHRHRQPVARLEDHPFHDARGGTPRHGQHRRRRP